MLGIMGAIKEEVAALVQAIAVPTERTIGGRKYYSGNLFGQPAVIVESRWGKVAAASTTAHLIATYKVDAIVFFGVAGSVDPAVRVGDIVVARDLYQHDLDASPLFPPMEIPTLGKRAIRADDEMAEWLLAAARRFAQTGLREDVAANALQAFQISVPGVHHADIATGDRFISSAAAARDIKERIPTAACVEMEGAAVAQVCFEHSVPCGVVRVISDNADHAASVDFQKFLERITARYALGLIRTFIQG